MVLNKWEQWLIGVAVMVLLLSLIPPAPKPVQRIEVVHHIVVHGEVA